MSSADDCQSVGALPAGPTIDTHLHVFDAASGRAPAAAVPAPPAGWRPRYLPAYAAPIEQWRGVAQACGVRRGVLVQPSFLGTDNSRLIVELQRTPQALRGVAVIDAGWTTSQLDTLDGHGVRGLRWNLIGETRLDPLADPRWIPLLEHAVALGWHLEVHTDPGALAAVAPHLPELPVPLVLDHFGRPATGQNDLDAVLRAAESLLLRHPVWVKLSAPYRVPGQDLQQAAQRWRDCVGGDRLLWGSDWPWTNHEQHQDYAALHRLPARWLGDGGAALLDSNAAALFGF